VRKDVITKVGTSGWTYPHWQGVFYPPDRPKSRWLEYYAQHFDTVELNATFYRLPKPKVFENWHNRTPDGFLWSVKASKYITHTKRLKEPREPLERLYTTASGLGDKLAVVLFQLPPNLAFHEERFKQFCGFLNPNLRHALEVRHPSWITDNVLDLLRQYNVALCIADTAGRYPFHEVVTADFVYIRLHGSRKLYASNYSEEELQAWAEKIKAWGKDTFVYFDNDFEGRAVKNAQRLKEILTAS
jgi:uncharacterized protein YecE (DUF72 family)